MSERPTARELTAPVFDGDTRNDPHPAYARLRAEAPVVWHEDPGIWVLSRYADVIMVNKDTATFSSKGGILPMEIGIEYPSPPTMMHTDPPEHTRLRTAVAEGFRPSRIAALEPDVSDHVAGLVAALPTAKPFDVVESLAAPLPLMVICDLLGLPSSDWPLFWQWSDAVIPGAADMSDQRRGELKTALEALLRRHIAACEGLVADLCDRGLDDEEVYILLNQLLVAGNETTRNLVSAGLLALAENHQEWAKLVADPVLIPSAVEELLRWTTPVASFMRTATRDVEIGGQAVHAGDPVLMLWASANRDEAEFGADAGELHVDRDPNHHLAFGFGPHFCVGAALARMEGRLVLEALVGRYATLEPAGQAVRSPSTVIAGFQSVPLVGSAG
ncbi:MAG: cytochrome P450 [Actinomycetia bacterium]|nr:cytochrome P450 [Actinomycetes bacterium]